MFKSTIFLTTVFAAVLASCPRKTVLRIDDNFERSCSPCNANCSICYLGPDASPICAFCEEGYYMDSAKNCLPCAAHCSSCVGPDIKQCRTAANGYYYDEKSHSLLSCDNPACQTCASKGVCTSCSEGYYMVSKNETETSLSVRCEPCGIENCLFCSHKSDQIKSSVFNSCSLCKSGYSLVSGKCQACPENCSYCREESGECSFCDRGFFLDKKTNRCEKVTQPFCFSLNSNHTCEICDNHYYLTANHTCEPCKKQFPHCSFCAGKDEALSCLSCEIGFKIDKNGACTRCPENCNHCNSEGCLSCFTGYYFAQNSGQCEKCPIENCEICRSADVCDICMGGYYFDAKLKKCTPCKGNCLRCFDDTEDCRACPVNFFTFQQQIVSQKKTPDNIFANLLSLFVGFNTVPLGPVKVSEIRIITKCVSQCPKSYKDKAVAVNIAERKCVFKLGDTASVALPSSKPNDDILHTIAKLKIKYDEEIEATKARSLSDKSRKGSDECFKNGLLRREIRGDQNSYYICRCNPGFVGDNCQISHSLFESTQHKLAEFLDEIQKEFVNHTRHNKRKFLKAMIHLNKFRMGRPVVGKMVDLIQKYLQKDRELDNKKHLYLLYDAVLLNLFDQLEDLRKAPLQTAGADTELQTEREELYALIHHLVEMLETSLEDHQYLGSFLEVGSSDNFNLDTFSFMVAEYRLSSYDKETGFVVRNANIDTSYNVQERNRIKFEFEGDFSPSVLKNHIQVMTLASPLFDDKLKELGYKPVSNLLYLKFLNPARPHEIIYNRDNKVRKLILIIALNYLPVYTNTLGHVVCLASFFGANKSSIIGEAVRFDEATKTVECEFSAYFEFRNYYFGIMIRQH